MKLSALQGAEFRMPDVESNRQTTHSTKDIQNSEEAAKSFEKVLVQQFVNVMTDQMFKSSLSGEDGPGWMNAYADTQRKVLSDVLTDHLVDNDTFNLSTLVLQQWQRQGLIDEE